MHYYEDHKRKKTLFFFVFIVALKYIIYENEKRVAMSQMYHIRKLRTSGGNNN